MPNQPSPQPSSRPLAPLVAAGFGLVAGLLVQFGLARSGQSPLVPPYSLAISLAAIAAVLLVFGLRLKRTIADPHQQVDPFHAVRVLVSARAGSLVGGLFGGFGAGLVLSLLGRSVPAPTSTWLPMVMALVAGVALVICGVLTERWCRVPPNDGEKTAGNEEEEGGPETQTAYRRP
ncbi:hypothetical protein JOF28_001009 [Leucobacter exalbidus]|uniref:DUF3180 domain-containing protein n=1 Tax=Leucobacter exalbidus TaxID=662960 RepID=A0A940PKU5_9MICO|nr:DUF3180 domain-containing protein [Leucobacter exalbidus]MBP1325777.1 hypothetical protein [Leucobacter exalbidus]